MITRSPAPYHRDERLLVLRLDDDAVQRANGVTPTINGIVREKNPDAMPAPEVTEMVLACDIVTRSCHLVLVHRVDYRPRLAPPIGSVAVFSKSAYAPDRTPKLQLGTPAYYRDQEDLPPGIRDSDDGSLTKDGTVWASSIMGGTVSALLRFASSSEPWVYCASHYRNDSELRRLKNEFDVQYGYPAATRIEDPAVFAIWLGVDFALGLDKTADVTLSPIDEAAYARSRYSTDLWDGSGAIATVAHVYHGPVCYEDVSGSVDTQEQWFDPYDSQRAWFTKKTLLESQSEYRFAVTTPGNPVQLKHYVAVSPELRALTCPL